MKAREPRGQDRVRRMETVCFTALFEQTSGGAAAVVRGPPGNCFGRCAGYRAWYTAQAGNGETADHRSEYKWKGTAFMRHPMRSIFSLILVAAIVFGFLPTGAWAAFEAVGIHSLTEITDMAGNYLLLQDTTVSEPVGSADEQFTGFFNGGGHTITIEITGTGDCTGMFASLGSGAVVQNFTVDPSVVTNQHAGTRNSTGLIAGKNQGTIADVTVYNSKVYGDRNVGGLVGENSGSIIRCAMEGGLVEQSHNPSPTDWMDYNAGGLAGVNSGSIETSSNSATVSHGSSNSSCDRLGGIAGRNDGIIASCYNTGNVVADAEHSANYMAGITPYVGWNGASVTGCYNYGTLTATSGNQSRVYAVAPSASACYYWDGCGSSNGQGTAKTAEEFQSLAGAMGSEWRDGLEGYPVLSWQNWKYSMTAIAYTVEHYTEDLTGDGYTLAKAVTRRAEPGTEVTAEALELTGFTLDEDHENNVRAGTVESGLVLKLYYSRNSYLLSWNPGEGVITSADEAYTHGTVRFEAPVTAPAVERKGYTVTWDPAFSTMPAADTEVKAVWKAGQYAVTWDANGGTVQPTVWNTTYGYNTDKVTYGLTYGQYQYESYYYGTVTEKRSLPVPVHESMAFAGWYTAPEGGDLVTEDTPVTTLEDHTLYAHWEEGYTVTFDPNGGKLDSTTYHVRKNETLGSVLAALPSPTRSGMAFDGWFDDQGNPVALDTVIRGDVTYTARWRVYTYTVNFHANGGVGEMEPQTFTVGDGQKLHKNTFTREGFRFLGWTKSSYSTTVVYPDEAVCTELPGVDRYTYHFYAQWEEIRHTLTFQTTPEDAAIEVRDASGTVQSGENGVYRLLEGTYTYVVSKYGWTSQEGSLTLTGDQTVPVTLEQLPTYDVTFHVTKPQDTGDAEIVIRQGQQTISPEQDGHWRLTAGTYTYTVKAAGCGKATGEFTVTDRAVELDIVLEYRTAWDGETYTEPAVVTAEQAAQEDSVYFGKEGWYIIGTPDELAWLAQYHNSQYYATTYALLVADVDLGGENWTAIGSSYVRTYSGVFEGNGHTVRGLACASASVSYLGLFGNVKNATIQNLTVCGQVQALERNAAYTGGLAAWLEDSKLIHCGVCVDVTNIASAYSYAGGIVGYVARGSNVIEGCYHAGTVSCGGALGGLIGGINNGDNVVRNCYHTGTIAGGVEETQEILRAGGLIGFIAQNEPMSLTLDHCYSASEMTGMEAYRYVGGIVGEAMLTTPKPETERLYYLNTVLLPTGTGECGEPIRVSATHLKSSAIRGRLGEAFKADGVGGEAVNQGYPVLSWQTLPEHVQHVWDGGTVTQAPTCTEPGVRTFHCLSSECEETKTETIDSLGHDYTEEVVPPTCETKGYTVHTCTRCGHSYEDTYVDALGHCFGQWEVTEEATCAKAGRETRTCTNCGQTETREIPALEHSWSAWTVIEAATCTQAGTQERRCTVCGTVQTEQTAPIACPSEGFQDVAKAAWYHDAVDLMTGRGYMIGVSENIFGTNQVLTRAQLVTILYRMAGSPDVKGLEHPFTDVDRDGWYRDAVCWAAANEVVKGMGNGRFAPNAPITREQIVEILYRYAKAEPVEADCLQVFQDTEHVSGWARTSVNWAVSVGLIVGVPAQDGTILLQPQGGATRAQTATILTRFLQEAR